MRRTTLIGLIWTAFMATPAPAQAQDELERLRAENAALKEQVAQLKAELAKLTLTNEDLEVQKRQLTELAGLTPQGERVASRSALIEELYNEAEDRTIVRSKPELMDVTRGSKAGHYMTVAYSYPGRDPAATPATVRWYIQTRFSGGVYQGERGLRLLIDGEDEYVTLSDYHKHKRQSGIAGKRRVNRDDETLTIELSPELLRKLARATEVEGSIRNVRFDLTMDQIATFRAMRKRIELDGHPQ